MAIDFWVHMIHLDDFDDDFDKVLQRLGDSDRYYYGLQRNRDGESGELQRNILGVSCRIT